MEAKVKFTARMFVTLQYKNNNLMQRSANKTIPYYKRMIKKQSFVSIDKFKLVYKNRKGGKHDQYAIGNYYDVEGTALKHKTKEMTKFMIFHNVRVDYWNCSPILYNSIKIKEV